MRLILASTSPRRRELLGLLGLEFDVVASGYEESELPAEGQTASDWVMELARGKASDVAGRADGDALVIGADTTVTLDGRTLGKPISDADARRMLGLLSGNTHQVYTGICIVPVQNGIAGEPTTDFAVTDVLFDAIPDETIAAYAATGEPMDKAGAYGIQGKALAFISGIAGDYFNVVGLPLHKLCGLLARHGVSIWNSEAADAQTGQERNTA